MKLPNFILGGVLLVIAATAVPADTLVLKDGDTLFGEFIKIADGALFFRTHLAGKVIVPTDEVESLNAEREMTIALADGRRASGRLVLDAGVAHIVRPDGTDHALELGAIAAAMPRTEAEPSPSLELAAADTGLHGAWETGVHWHTGDDDYADLFARLTLRSESERQAFWADAFVERADPEVFPRWFLAGAEWRLLPERSTYSVIGLAVERDTDKALAARGDLTVALGRTFAANERQELRGDVGLNAETAHYDAQTRWRDQPSWLRGDQRKDRQRLNLRLGLRYAWAILGNGQISGRVSLYPGLTDWGNLRARSESSVVFPFGQRLSLKLHVLLDYEGEPEFDGLEQWRTSIGASVLWGF